LEIGDPGAWSSWKKGILTRVYLDSGQSHSKSGNTAKGKEGLVGVGLAGSTGNLGLPVTPSPSKGTPSSWDSRKLKFFGRMRRIPLSPA